MSILVVTSDCRGDYVRQSWSSLKLACSEPQPILLSSTRRDELVYHSIRDRDAGSDPSLSLHRNFEYLQS